jgi:hypothetical protein
VNQPEDGNRYREALLSETREELQRADAKASILLAATGIAFSALLAAAGAGTWTPEKLQHGDARLAVWCSLALGLVGIGVLGSAVKPRFQARAMDREKLHYFGNVRAFWPTFWPLGDRKQRLEDGRLAFETALKKASTNANYEARLDDQIWFLGRIAFRKYRLVTISMWVFAISIGLAVAGLLLERF